MAIVFVGSVFSPHYARALARGPQPPERHLAVNVALYGARRAWAFAEQAAAPGALRPRRLQVGRSVCTQDGDALRLSLDVPRGLGRRPLRGSVVVHYGAAGAARPLRLDADGRHRWWPLAPCARVEADFPELGVHFVGRGYHDANFGDEPLARGFACWQWMRAVAGARTAVDYVATAADGALRRLHLDFLADGQVRRRPAPSLAPLAASGWRVARAAPRAWRLVRALEDTPFYVRSLLTRARPAAPKSPGHTGPASAEAAAVGEPAAYAVHEALDMRRWQRGWVKFLLPFRLRRLR